ncbi:MAG TPA: lysophospholipid acyltransferase family protein [Planctomycetota bacterium]|nr:lysophospholipid acyltransferase family protein [Planctomycetota bacterium]
MDPRATRQARRELAAERHAERTRRGRNSAGLARWRRFRRRVGSLVLDLLAPVTLRLLALTWRVQREGAAGRALLASSSPWIVAMWHGRMVTLMPLSLHKDRDIHVLVSPSDDGGLATKALRKFRFRAIRGSLSHRGARALREMTDSLRGGEQLVVTPDGPRGPRHSMNVGIAWLARATGAPILPVGVACSRAWHLRSWDRFTIPKPFARLAVLYGDPVRVEPDAADSALELVATSLRERLLALERAGFAVLATDDDLDEPEDRAPV